ncbi:MAG: hypothetical protein QOD40_2466 [Alphaproteobacteria bacterium]|nr:hypothetical protein [Alphaproteobacteria bacterium]
MLFSLCPALVAVCLPSSLPGVAVKEGVASRRLMTRQSIVLAKKMDARIKSAHDECIARQAAAATQSQPQLSLCRWPQAFTAAMTSACFFSCSRLNSGSLFSLTARGSGLPE